MSKTKGDDSVHPQVYEHPEFGGQYLGEFGLTKREYFAAMALQGILANTHFYEEVHEKHMADHAVIHADALIKVLNGGNE